MSESGIQPGNFVRNNRPSAPKPEVGIVLELDGENAQVEFWDSSNVPVPQRFLEPLSGDTPEALLWERPDELALWATERPLNLVASALSISGKTGKVADIREKLDGRVPLGSTWDNWWKKRTKSLGNLPQYFGKSIKGNEYILLSNVDDVPPDWTPPPKPKAATVADWKKWLNSKTHEPTPGRFPTKQVSDALIKWPEKTIDQALYRVMATSEQFLAAGDVSSQAAEGWLRAVAQASLRWREVADPDSRGYQAARVGALLASLARIAGDRTPQDLLLRAGELDGEAEAWRRGFAAGMWESFDGDGARDMYFKSSAVLRGQDRSGLAREIALAAFGPDYSDRRHSALDHLLDALPESERAQLLGEMIAGATSGTKSGVLDYIANSRHAAGSEDPSERLNLLLAAILLSNGQDQVAAQASRELAAVLDTPEEYGPAAQAISRDTRARIAEEHARIAGELDSQRQTHAAELEREQREQERWRQQVRERNAELAANREESRLEIRQDMLLAVGEVLQMVARHQGGVDELAGNVEAGLTLALRAGGADLLDTAPEGKVVAPGVIVRGGLHGDRVLLKAQVKHEAG